jgi:diguanylate cyclase (GGDEF)-like protein
MLQSLLRRFTKYVGPTTTLLAGAAVVLGAMLVVMLVSAPLSEHKEKPLGIVALEDSAGTLQEPSAYTSLRRAERLVIEQPTNRSESPFWLLTEPTSPSREVGSKFELPSRHIQSLRFWIYDENDTLLDSGQIDRQHESGGSASHAKAGFAISLPQHASPVRLLVRVLATGPARLSIQKVDSQALDASNQYFDRSGGLLFGSLLMIAAFSLLISALARDFTFFIFGAWVISSLRFASYSAGWDFSWIGFAGVEDHPILVKNLPLAAYAVFTVTLFWSIFRRDIARLHATSLVRILFFISISLVAVALVMPHRYFLPLLWSAVVPSVMAMMWLTVSIFAKTGSSAAAWYGASWIATLTGVLSEVAFAAGLTETKPPLLSSLGGAVIAALLAGIALAQRLKSEKSGRIAAQSRTVNLLQKFRENYNSMPVGLFSVQLDGTLTMYNPAFAEIFDIRTFDVNERRIRISELLGEEASSLLSGKALTTDDQDVEIKVQGNDNQDRWFLARVATKGESIEGSIQEITARKEAENKLRHLVDHDPLTGLLNRRGLEEALNSASNAAAALVSCAIAHIDLDRFKLVNDLYGHAIGDAMLIEAAARLKGTVRGRDQIARIADSFVVVFQDCPDHAVVRLTERLRQAIGEHPFEIHGKALNMTVSVGVVPMEPEMSPVDAMTSADHACAEAKARGRNCVVRLSEKDAALRSHLKELRVVADLQQRISTDRYFLEFQPIVSLRAPNSALSYEVLLRMRDEAGLVVPPSRFIGAAERNGLMSQIDRWVLRSTLEWLDQHPEHRERLTFATINLSGASLNDVRFVDDAFAMMHDHPQAVTKLCFEITESVALNDLASTRRFVDRVRTFGSRLALDDFGAGYTSFNYLKEIPAEFIKIDGSFVRDINRNPANYAITRTIVDLTHELGMSSIAEWAETADTIASLMELSVDYAQGFSLARPMPKEMLAEAHSSGSLVLDRQVLAIIESDLHPALNLHPGHRRI